MTEAAAGRPTPADQLASVLEAVTSSDPPSAIAARLGEAASGVDGSTIRILPSSSPDVVAIEYEPPNDDRGFGVAALELAEDAGWVVRDVEASLAPLRELPALHRPSYQLQGIWDQPDAAAWAAVFLDVGNVADGDGRIHGITIRIEPRD